MNRYLKSIIISCFGLVLYFFISRFYHQFVSNVNLIFENDIMDVGRFIMLLAPLFLILFICIFDAIKNKKIILENRKCKIEVTRKISKESLDGYNWNYVGTEITESSEKREFIVKQAFFSRIGIGDIYTIYYSSDVSKKVCIIEKHERIKKIAIIALVPLGILVSLLISVLIT